MNQYMLFIYQDSYYSLRMRSLTNRGLMGYFCTTSHILFLDHGVDYTGMLKNSLSTHNMYTLLYVYGTTITGFFFNFK